MDRILCVIFCVLVMVVAVFVLACCGKPAVEAMTTGPTAMPTVAPTEEVATQESTEAIEETEPPTEPTEPPAVPETEPTEATEATEVTEPPYTDEELEMMAIVIFQEAGGDYFSDETRLMVGTVVMNRVADDRFPDTIYEVLTQKSQYGLLHWTGIVWPERASYPNEAHAVERAYECAERILNGERFLPEDVVWQAEFPQGTEIVAFQDETYFCR